MAYNKPRTRGGKRVSSGSGSGSATSTQQQILQQQAQQTQQQVQNTPPITNFSDFLKMTDDEKADVINQLLAMTRAEAVPNFLDDSITQRLAYNLELDATPDVVDSKTFDSLSGKPYYRTVGDGYDSRTGVYYKPSEITDQLMHGLVTRYNSGGGTSWGSGIYFSDTYTDSYYYGNVNSSRSRAKGITKEMVRMKFKPTARVATQQTLQRIINGYGNSKLGRTISRLSSDDRYTVTALANGYDAIDWKTSGGYHTILNRGALVFDQNTKKDPQKYTRW